MKLWKTDNKTALSLGVEVKTININIKVNNGRYEFEYANEAYQFTCGAENIFQAKQMFLSHISGIVDDKINSMLESKNQ